MNLFYVSGKHERRSFDDAIEYCKICHGRLAEPRTPEKNSELMNFVALKRWQAEEFDPNTIWIGVKKLDDE